MITIEEFSEQKECEYKGEHYLVRDNGAVYKCQREGKAIRPTDNQWTFGHINFNTGYLEIASVRVHRIVATAFHGSPPNEKYVVDHIDTNRQNNRPENLRWVTRLENTLLNPITRKKIEYVCGTDIFTFLSEPEKFRDKFISQDYSWMRCVTKEEATICLKHMYEWIPQRDKIIKNNSTVFNEQHKMGEWIFHMKDKAYNTPIAITWSSDTKDLTPSLTSVAVQRKWKTPTEFPCCPLNLSENPIKDYFNNLKRGKVFCRNQYGQSKVNKFVFCTNKESIIILTKNIGDVVIKPWALAEITYENGKFIHTSLGTFFEYIGAEKQFILAQGLEWTGGDCLDDFC